MASLHTTQALEQCQGAGRASPDLEVLQWLPTCIIHTRNKSETAAPQAPERQVHGLAPIAASVNMKKN